IVPASPTLKDRYPKVSGNLRAKGFLYSFGNVFDNASKTDTVWFFNESDTVMHIKVVGPANDPFRLPPDVTVFPTEQDLAPGRESYFLVTVDGRKAERLGFQVDNLRLLTNDSQIPLKNFSVGSYITEYFPPMSAEDSLTVPKARMLPTTVDLGKIASGKRAETTVRVYNDGIRPLEIRNAYSGTKELSFEFSGKSVASQDSVSMKITFDTKGVRPGPFRQRVSLFVSDPTHPELRLQLSGTIE
ncbi:MAG: hypothetical protein RL021_1318, partial [Bacteroidota bacterium]